jgi:tRNA (guanine-N7-)-methyltransferase
MGLFLKPRMLSSVENNLSKRVFSNQQSIHPNLARISDRHKDLLKYQNPISAESARILKSTQDRVEQSAKPLIMDCGCGTGESAVQLARALPDHTIVAIDKSIHRLNKARKHLLLPENLIFLRADLPEIWLYAYRQKWNIKKQYLLYPNPWPKQEHLMRRWHAHPIMPYLLSSSQNLELRTNWKIYAHEFAWAAQYFLNKEVEVQSWLPETPISNFELKYLQSGHELYRVHIVQND